MLSTDNNIQKKFIHFLCRGMRVYFIYLFLLKIVYELLVANTVNDHEKR